ncbi:MAG: DUF5658 family protein [Archaeoglobaceae archaeon]
MTEKFRLLILIMFALWTADVATTLYAISNGLGFELNPLYYPSPNAFFFIKGLVLGVLAVMAYELGNRNLSLALKCLRATVAVLSAIVIWNVINIAISYAQLGL